MEYSGAYLEDRFAPMMDEMITECAIRERQKFDRLDRRLEPCLKNTLGFLGRKYAGHMALAGVFSLCGGSIVLAGMSWAERVSDNRLQHRLLQAGQAAGFQPSYASLNTDNNSLDFYQPYAACLLSISESPTVGYIVRRPTITPQIEVIQNYNQLATLAMTSDCLPPRTTNLPVSTPNRR